jgi:ribosome maturation factor RimP
MVAANSGLPVYSETSRSYEYASKGVVEAWAGAHAFLCPGTDERWESEVTDNSVSGRVRQLVEPVLIETGIELFDVERHGSVLKVTIDRPGGVDLDAISEATRRISAELDRNDPVAGRYLLEVTSPGIERALRVPAHFQGAVGADVAVKLQPGAATERRVEGILESADDTGIVVAGTRLAYSDIQSTRTRFVWPERPKAGNRPAPKQKAGKK